MRGFPMRVTLEPRPGRLATVGAADPAADCLSQVVAAVADADSFDARIIISLLTYSTNQ